MERVADIKRQAQNHIKQGQWDEAIKAYEKLARVADPDPYLHVLIGDVHLRRGDSFAAMDAYRLAIDGYRAAGLLKNAVALAKKLLRYDAQRPLVLALLGELSAQDGLAGDAAAYYATAADELVVGGDQEQAIRMLAQGVAVSPMHADCSNRMVDLLTDMGRNEDAARELLRLVAALRMAGREDAVPYLLERARALDPAAELPTVEAPAASALAGHGQAVISNLREALQGAGAPRPAAESAPAAPPPPAESSGPERLAGLEGVKIQKAPEAPARPAASPISGNAEGPRATAFSKSADALARAAEEAGVEDSEIPAEPAEKPAAEPVREPAATAPAAPPESEAPPLFVEPEVPDGPRVSKRAVSVKDDAPGPGPLIDLSKILEEFKQGLEQQIGPDDAKSHYDMAMAFMEMNLLGDAVAELAAASHDATMRPRCCELLGQCYLRQNLPQDAERILRRGLETPDLSLEASLSLRYHLALALNELGQADEAHTLMQEVVEVQADFMDAADHLERLRRRAS